MTDQQPNPSQGQMPPPPGGQQDQVPPQGMQGMQDDSISNEELIEAIIDEKWNELEKDINKIIEWKNNAENRLVTIEEKVKSLKDDFDKLHENILGKVGTYDKHIQDVSAEIQAMEKVFAKVLPVFTEKVDELSRISDDFKSAVGGTKNRSSSASQQKEDSDIKSDY
ncbi:MAG: hypothetical protein ACQESE_01340 [Nanobdellota archaeon]